MSQPLKILHLVSYHYYTGPAEPVMRLARSQMGQGHEVKLAFDRFRPGNMEKHAARFEIPVEDRLLLSVKSGPIMQLRDILALKKMWRESAYDIFHAHRSHDHSLVALTRPRKTHSRLIRTLFTERSLAEKRAWQLKRADALVTVAKKHRDLLLARNYLDPARVISIEGAVDPHVYRPSKDNTRVRREFSIAADAPVVGIVARMMPDRGHQQLLRAWEIVLKQRKDARLLIAGRGDCQAELEGQVASGSFGDSVIFMGYRTDLPEVYRAFDVKVILAPGNDGTCRAALEAMASGTPVLAVDRGALGEIVKDGLTGRVVPSDDPAVLAACLLEMLQHPELLKEMGKNARHEATRAFAIDRQAARIESLYYSVLKDKFT